MELGRVLGKGPLPLDNVRVGDTASDAHPNAGATWSSTGSESACAVRLFGTVCVFRHCPDL